jgi:histone-lysine N-methyltransferase SETMAR
MPGHTIALTTMNLLNTWNWEILTHTPHSPDLAPSDFHLFPKLKKHLRRLRFQTDEDVQQEVKRWLRLQHASFYLQGFDCLIYCHDNCLNRYGGYVEK